eukprot:1328134-Rhodomonas_salina.4
MLARQTTPQNQRHENAFLHCKGCCGCCCGSNLLHSAEGPAVDLPLAPQLALFHIAKRVVSAPRNTASDRSSVRDRVLRELRTIMA